MAGFRVGDYEQGDSLEPKKTGVEVFLKELPKYVEAEGDKSAKIIWTFKSAEKDKDQSESFHFFDFVNQKEDLKEVLRKANAGRGTSMYKAFMSVENQKKFDLLEIDTLEQLHNTALRMFSPDALNIKATIMFGYSTRSGYKEIPVFGSVISTPLRERNLVMDPRSLSLKPVKASQAKPDKEEDEDSDDV